jgi:pimeloyl-ACP methyl ester carboxylesterase
MDELLLAVMKSPKRYPRRADFERVGREVLEAADLFERRGWVSDPTSYHRDPPAVSSHSIEFCRPLDLAWTRGIPYEHLSFESGYEPHGGEPGRDRWLAAEPNRTAHAWVLRHPGPPRPWLVCLHGFGTGSAMMDLPAFRAQRLHRELGLNLVFPVMPCHGPRKTGPTGADSILSFDALNSIHGVAQGIWDVRRVVSWVRSEGAPAVGVYGMSFGGYMTALLAGLEDDLGCVIAGIPVSDLPRLFIRHAPAHIRRRAEEHGVWGDEADRVVGVISPLVFEPRVPHGRRFVFAGLADRLATPGQAQRLWLHWDRPTIHWYPGNHVGFFWTRKLGDFVDAALVTSGLAELPAASATT